MTYVFSQTQIETLTAFRDAGDYASMYAEVYSITANPDANGNSADPMVREWFRAAAEANSGVGAAADLIRDYTDAQVFMRNGQNVSSAHMQEASNDLADRLFVEYLSEGGLPTLKNIEDTDKDVIIASLNANGYDVDASVWSGNLLFVGLGSTSPLSDNLLQNTSSTYDLFASSAALQKAGLGTVAGSLIDSFLATWSLPVSAGASANQLINQYLTQAYGDFAPTAIQLFGTSYATVDRAGTHEGLLDPGAGTYDDFVHAGGGDDTIVGTYGQDFVDGGTGIDTITFARGSVSPDSVGLTLDLFGPGQQTIPFSGVVTWEGGGLGSTQLFDIEKVGLGVKDDVVKIYGPTTVTEVDGYDNKLGGDTIDASEADAAINADLSTSKLTTGSTEIDILNFENVTGTSLSDTITGDDKNNVIDGGGGADTIDGGGGQDTILFDNLDASVQGGAGYDVGLAVGATAPDLTDGLHRSDANSSEGVTLAGHDHGIEVVLGGSGNDTLTVAHSTETRDKQITLTLDAHHWSEDEAGDDGRDFFNPVSNVGDKRILDLSGVNIVDGGQGDDILIGYSGEILDAGAPPSMLMGGMGDDTYHLSLPANNEEYDPGLQQIYDQDGVGRIYVGGVEISNLTLGGWDRGFDGQGDGDFYWWHSDPLPGEPHRSQNVGTSVNVYYDQNDLYVQVIQNYNDPTITSGPTWIGSDETGFVIRDFEPGDFGIQFKLWEDGSVFAGADGPGAVNTSELQFEGADGDETDNTLIASDAGGPKSGKGGDDLFIAGTGADELIGGTGIDTVSYKKSVGPVIASLFAGVGAAGASGDTYDSIENIHGSSHGDTLTGDATANILRGESGDDQLFGLSGEDELIGGTGNDQLSGGDGGDTYVYAWDYGTDTIFDDGGTGVDRIVFSDDIWSTDATYSYSGTDLVIELNYYNDDDKIIIQNVAQQNYSAGMIEFFEFSDNVTLSMLDIQNKVLEDALQSGATTIIGTYSDDIIAAGSGNQAMSGMAGSDIFSFSTGDGQDVITDFEPGTDSIIVNGETITDLANPPAGVAVSVVDDNLVLSYGSSDTITILTSPALVTAYPSLLNTLHLIGGPDAETLIGGVGGDTLEGRDGHDRLYGGDGDDQLIGGRHGDRLYGEAGDDVIDGGHGTDHLTGGTGNDILTGGVFSDTFYFTTGDGLDQITDFEVGTDKLIIDGNNISDPNNLPSGMSGVETATGYEFHYGAGDVVTLTGITEADLLAAARIVFEGTANDDIVTGLANSDDIHGADGSDTLSGGAGNDYLYGDGGNDTLNGDDGHDRLYGGDGDDLLTGGRHGDRLYGDAGDDVIQGGHGTDHLTGGTGNDIMTGGVFSDTFYFTTGDGLDQITDFEVGTDKLIIDGNNISDPNNLPSGMTGVETATGYEFHYGAGDVVTLTGITEADLLAAARIVFAGTANDDVVTGLANSDDIHGADGGDTLSGGAGNDYLYGDGGNDTLNGDDGHDRLYGGDGDDQLIGGRHGDRLYGEAGDDVIDGGHGTDHLTGGTGSDVLTGGVFSDTFYFTTGDGLDQITDFEVGTDKLIIDGLLVDLNQLPNDLTVVAGQGEVVFQYGSGDEITLHATTSLEASHPEWFL